MVLRQQIFAHIPGTADVKTGTEPLYAWIRLSIKDLIEDIPFRKYGFVIKINAACSFSGIIGSIYVNPKESAYPRLLKAETPITVSHQSCYIVEPDGKVRLAIAPGQPYEVEFLPKEIKDDGNVGDPDNLLFVSMPIRPF